MKIKNFIDGVIVTPIKILDGTNGKVYHGMKAGEQGFVGFGEAYFSTIEKSMIKGWKLHMEMTMNLVVPVGEIRFVIYDDRQASPTYKLFQEVILSKDKYFRLTIPPGLWLAFQGLKDRENILLNIASHTHRPSETIAKPLRDIEYCW